MAVVKGGGSPDSFGAQCLRALGLEPKQTRNLVITCPANGLVTVDIELLPTPEQADKLITVMKKYHVIFAPETEPHATE